MLRRSKAGTARRPREPAHTGNKAPTSSFSTCQTQPWSDGSLTTNAHEYTARLRIGIEISSLVFPGHDIGPQRFEVAGLTHVAPGRHVVLALGDRIGKARILPRRKRAQIEAAAGVVHGRPMAWHTVGGIDLGALVDLLARE